MQRRVFLKSGALALVTMGLSPSFLRRMVYAQGMPAGTERESADLSLPAWGGGRTQHRGAARGRRVLRTAPEHRDRAAGSFRWSHRSRRILRIAPGDGATQAAVGSRHARAGARGGKSEQHALALRRAGLHGVRHSRREGHAGRVAQSLSRCQGHVRAVRVSGVAVSGGRLRAADAAYPRGSGADHRNVEPRRLHHQGDRIGRAAARGAVSHGLRGSDSRRGRRDVRRREDAQGGEPAAVCRRARCAVSEISVRPEPQADRAAREG